MKIRSSLFSLSLLIALSFGIFIPSACPQHDQVLAPGDPPLTAGVAGKFIALMQWSLDVNLTKPQQEQVILALVDQWKANDRAAMKAVVDSAKMTDEIARASQENKARAKEIFRAEIMKGLQNDPADKLNRIFIEAINASDRSGTSTPSGVSRTSNSHRVGEDGFSGIYIGIYNPPPGVAISSVQTAFVTFLPDGHVYWTLPPEGLLNFDPAVARRAYPDDWGTYKVSGAEVHVTLGNGLRRVFLREGRKLILQRYEGQNRSSTEYTFSPLATGDGVKLQGSYRRFPGDLAITFTNTGTFRDEGFTQNFGTIGRPDGSTYQDDGRGGSGTYLIEQNTLELKYSDGRTKRFAFTALPENLARSPVPSFRINYEVFKVD